jgi:hypothetical protein
VSCRQQSKEFRIAAPDRVTMTDESQQMTTMHTPPIASSRGRARRRGCPGSVAVTGPGAEDAIVAKLAPLGAHAFPHSSYAAR